MSGIGSALCGVQDYAESAAPDSVFMGVLLVFVCA